MPRNYPTGALAIVPTYDLGLNGQVETITISC
jgi:hypothetical protein